MVFRNIQAAVPLEGRGFVSKGGGDYLPGEYRKLTNMELVDGRLVRRKDIHANFDADDDYKGVYGKIGNFKHWSIYASRTHQIAVSSVDGEVLEMWDPTKMSLGFAPEPGASLNFFTKLVGFFKYNGYNYWITLMNDSYSMYGGVGIYTYFSAETSTDRPTDYAFDGLQFDGVGLLNIVPTNSDYLNTRFITHFLFKERLWIVTSKAVYFSVATNPRQMNTFLYEDAGFFRFPDTEVRWAMAIRDSIYVVCKDAVYSITYGTDPNADSVVRRISDVGGNHGCVFRDTPFFINYEGIFSITGNQVEKVMEVDFDEGPNNFFNQRLTPYQNYLVLNKTHYNQPDEFETSMRTNYHNNPSWNSPFWYGDNELYNTRVASNPTSELYRVTFEKFTYSSESDRSPDDLLPYPDTLDPDKQNVLRVKIANNTQLIKVSALGVFGEEQYDINVKVGEVYILSAWVWSDAPLYQGTRGRAYVRSNIATDPLNSGFVYIKAPVYKNIHGAGWQRVDCSVRVNQNCKISLFIEFSAPVVQGVWGQHSGEFFIAGRMIEEGFTILPYFDGNSPSLNGSDRFWFGSDESINLYSASAKNASARDKNLVPYYNSTRAAADGNVSDHNTYFINMDNGAVHVLDYQAVDGPRTHVVAVDYNTTPNPANGLPSLILLSNNGDMANPQSYISFLKEKRTPKSYDEVVASPVNLKKAMFSEIEIDSYVPDGVEYLMKKFRSLEIMGVFPNYGIDFRARFGSQNLMDPELPVVSIKDVEDATRDDRPHFPHRVGINQRGRAITLNLKGPVGLTLADDVTNYYEISDLRLLWAYTERGVQHSGYNSNNR